MAVLARMALRPLVGALAVDDTANETKILMPQAQGDPRSFGKNGSSITKRTVLHFSCRVWNSVVKACYRNLAVQKVVSLMPACGTMNHSCVTDSASPHKDWPQHTSDCRPLPYNLSPADSL